MQKTVWLFFLPTSTCFHHKLRDLGLTITFLIKKNNNSYLFEFCFVSFWKKSGSLILIRGNWGWTQEADCHSASPSRCQDLTQISCHCSFAGHGAVEWHTLAVLLAVAHDTATCRWPLGSPLGKQSPAIVAGSLWFPMLVTLREGPKAQLTSLWTCDSFQPLSPPPQAWVLSAWHPLPSPWPGRLPFNSNRRGYSLLQRFPQIISSNLKKQNKTEK